MQRADELLAALPSIERRYVLHKLRSLLGFTVRCIDGESFRVQAAAEDERCSILVLKQAIRRLKPSLEGYAMHLYLKGTEQPLADEASVGKEDADRLFLLAEVQQLPRMGLYAPEFGVSQLGRPAVTATLEEGATDDEPEGSDSGNDDDDDDDYRSWQDDSHYEVVVLDIDPGAGPEPCWMVGVAGDDAPSAEVEVTGCDLNLGLGLTKIPLRQTAADKECRAKALLVAVHGLHTAEEASIKRELARFAHAAGFRQLFVADSLTLSCYACGTSTALLVEVQLRAGRGIFDVSALPIWQGRLIHEAAVAAAVDAVGADGQPLGLELEAPTAAAAAATAGAATAAAAATAVTAAAAAAALLEALYQPDAAKPSLHRLVWQSICAAPVDLRRDLLANIVITGGLETHLQFAVRLKGKIEELMKSEPPPLPAGPSAAAGRVSEPPRPSDGPSPLFLSHAPWVGSRVKITNPPESRYSAWIGGSILGSMCAFRYLWQSTKRAFRTPESCSSVTWAQSTAIEGQPSQPGRTEGAWAKLGPQAEAEALPVVDMVVRAAADLVQDLWAVDPLLFSPEFDGGAIRVWLPQFGEPTLERLKARNADGLKHTLQWNGGR